MGFTWSSKSSTVEILKLGTGFDAQKQFMANIQDAKNSPIDLPTQISKYQNVLKYARSKVDFSYGLGLYMSPSDMVLQIGTIIGYNNKIVIATENQTLGFNSDVNVKPIVSTPVKPVEGTPTKPVQPPIQSPSPPAGIAQTPQELTLFQKYKDYAKQHNLPIEWVYGCIQNPGYFEDWLKMKGGNNSTTKKITIQHDDNKTAIIVGSITIGLAALLIYEIS